MKLNLGCGNDYKKGFTNVDINPNSSADIIASMVKLPFAEGEVEEIYCSHALEHLDEIEGEMFFREAYRVLKDNGKLVVITPDTERCMRKFLESKETDRWSFWIKTIYGFSWPSVNEQHKFGYTKKHLTNKIKEEGFKKIDINKKIFSHNTPSIYICSRKESSLSLTALAKTKLQFYWEHPDLYRLHYDFVNFWVNGWPQYLEEKLYDNLILESALHFPLVGVYFMREYLKVGDVSLRKHLKRLEYLHKSGFLDAVAKTYSYFSKENRKISKCLLWKKIRILVSQHLLSEKIIDSNIVSQKIDNKYESMIFEYFNKTLIVSERLHKHLTIFVPDYVFSNNQKK